MKHILGLLLGFCLTCCSSPEKTKNNCTYTLNNLLEKYDTSRVEVVRKDGVVDVYDRPNRLEERGIYRFDERGILRFYGYLINENNDYYFGIEFDSLGHVIKEPPNDVVRWYVSNLGGDSVKISFVLCTLNNAYGDVTLQGVNFRSNIPLQQSGTFSNLIGGDLVISKPTKREVYIHGISQNKCTHQIHNFKDSVYLTDEFLR